MSKTILLFLCLLAVWVLVACNKTETPTTSSNNANTSKPAPSTATTSTTSSTASTEKIGVAECDDFLAKYDACITKSVPEAARAQYNTTLAQWRKSWHDLAANPQTKATLATACKQAMESARTSMKTYHCTF